MTVLLDTQILLWSQVSPQRLPSWLVDILEDPNESPIFSVVSIWEIVIKSTLKKKDFAFDPHLVRSSLLDLSWREMAFDGEHVLAVCDLPAVHGDPFDRALLAQAKAAGLKLITSDKLLAGYGSIVRLI